MFDNAQYILSSDVRIRLSKATSEWRVFDLSTGKAWRVSDSYVEALTNFDSPRELASLSGEFTPYAEDAIGKRILVPITEENDAAEWYRWAGAHGWRESGDLIRLNDAYPIRDYGAAGLDEAEAAASSRTPDYLQHAATTANAQKVRDLPGTLDSARSNTGQGSLAGRRDLETILTVGLGILGYKTVRGRRVPRGVRPSFGALWSVQAYVGPRNLQGVERSWHRFDPELGRIEPLKVEERPEDVDDLIPAVTRSQFEPKAVAILTIRWERLRQRYRDPHAVSSAVIEAGHVAAAMGTAASALGVRTYVQSGNDELSLARKLHLPVDPCEESIISAMAFS